MLTLQNAFKLESYADSACQPKSVQNVGCQGSHMLSPICSPYQKGDSTNTLAFLIVTSKGGLCIHSHVCTPHIKGGSEHTHLTKLLGQHNMYVCIALWTIFVCVCFHSSHPPEEIKAAMVSVLHSPICFDTNLALIVCSGC